MTEIKRLYSFPPHSSFFLLGPRGTGKSTWVRTELKTDLTINLLDSGTFLDLKRHPENLAARVAHLPEKSVVCIDEVQRIPELLNDVHLLIEEKKLHFILTGSSARKLKRSGANLLAGRALTQKFFPFSLKELNEKYSIEQLLQFGSLPVVLGRFDQATEVLSSYVETYLREEIREEALTRNFDEFSRFLEIAAQLNGQVLNLERIGSEAGCKGATIRSWYQILSDTLIGTMVPSFRPGFKVREVAHSKFYFFDPGVVRSASGVLHEPLDAVSKGFLFETLVLNELKIYNEITRRNRLISFYSSPGSEEIDFIVETRKKTINRPAQFVSIEVKSSKKWDRRFENASRALKIRAGADHVQMIGVYLGKERLVFENFHVYPIHEFVRELHLGSILFEDLADHILPR